MAGKKHLEGSDTHNKVWAMATQRVRDRVLDNVYSKIRDIVSNRVNNYCWYIAMDNIDSELFKAENNMMLEIRHKMNEYASKL
jgi:hypothetical protein